MPAFVTVLCWTPVGLLTALLHSWLIRRAIDRVVDLPPADAGQRMARGVPLRLLVLLPILAIVARQGLAACVGFVVGFVVGRWVAGRSGSSGRRGRFPMPDRRGLTDGH